ncbi:MAG: aminoacyl-tRNA hydrolase [Candidatus Melainabacteria bacterium]|nr:MAG: aminoacyl-tRNA hydrolase [Candidatus Melainabacteria bacterium]
MLIVNSRIQIPLSELDFSFARSGGPGGQNVNKVNSKAVLRWAVVVTDSLPYDVKARFLEKFANRLTAENEIIVTSQKFRDQNRNVEDCLEKLRAMIESVAERPTPRRPTKPSYSSTQKRVDKKVALSQKKKARRQVNFDD